MLIISVRDNEDKRSKRNPNKTKQKKQKQKKKDRKERGGQKLKGWALHEFFGLLNLVFSN